MDAIVLAAGFGSRLAGTTPKPLTPVAGVPLIDRTLAGLRDAGFRRVAVVVGHEGARVRAHVEAGWGPATPDATGFEVCVVENDAPELANGVSVLVGAAAVDAPFVIAMADHVVAPEVWAAARAHTPPDGGATLLVDRNIDRVFDLDDATKVATKAPAGATADAAARDTPDGDRIDRIGKHLTTYDAIDIGVFVATEGLADALRRVFDERGDTSLSDGVQRLADSGRMGVLDIGDAFWQDVDTPAMLAHAEALLTTPR